jgi:hypothetical protein
MTRDCTVEVRMNGIQVDVIAKAAGLPLQGRSFTRSMPDLPLDELDSLRRSEVKEIEVENLSNRVSHWLLADDFREIMRLWLSQGDRLRLIFSVDSRLQEQLDQVPFELLRTDQGGEHVVFHQSVESFVHLLPKVGSPPVVTATLDWPMKILLVRSNPADCGGRVPEATAIRDAIRSLGVERFGKGKVEVDLLSSEPGGNALGPPTWEHLQKAVLHRYHVLVYLGHGDIQKPYADQPSVSQLQLESDDPAFHEPVASKQLASLLHNNPIPVVVLAGCLTAAVPGAAPLPQLPAWMRGNQGMAQALVNSESGVLFAVGMRCQIDPQLAVFFLQEFFQSLFYCPVAETDPDLRGNVEAAVRAARVRLFLKQPYPPYWAGPMAFSNPLAREPLFEYLSRPITVTISHELSLALGVREQIFWRMLSELPAIHRPPSLLEGVEANRDSIQAELLKQGAMVLPEMVESSAGAAVKVPVTLAGPLAFRQLQAKISLAPGLAFQQVRVTQLLADAGYQVLVDLNDSGVFQVQLRPGAAKPVNLPNGVILEIDLGVRGDTRGICPVNLEVLATDCVLPFWPGNSAVIVTLP